MKIDDHKGYVLSGILVRLKCTAVRRKMQCPAAGRGIYGLIHYDKEDEVLK